MNAKTPVAPGAIEIRLLAKLFDVDPVEPPGPSDPVISTLEAAAKVIRSRLTSPVLTTRNE